MCLCVCVSVCLCVCVSVCLCVCVSQAMLLERVCALVPARLIRPVVAHCLGLGHGFMGRGGKEAEEGPGKRQRHSSEQQRSHHADRTSPRPAGAHPRGGPLVEGKAPKPPRKTPLPPTDKVRATPTIEECGRYNWMTRFVCRQCGDSRPLAPGLWTTEGGQSRPAPGTPGNSVYKQTLLAPSAQGGDASKVTGKGQVPGDTSTRGTCRNTGKGLGVHHRGWGPDGQEASDRRTGKSQTSRPGPAPRGPGWIQRKPERHLPRSCKAACKTLSRHLLDQTEEDPTGTSTLLLMCLPKLIWPRPREWGTAAPPEGQLAKWIHTRLQIATAGDWCQLARRAVRLHWREAAGGGCSHGGRGWWWWWRWWWW